MNEKELIEKGISDLRNKLKSVSNIAEKQVSLFYYKELEKVVPCPDNEQFRKPGKGIGGFGDKMVFQKIVCRDAKNNPIFEDNKLKTKTCAFRDLDTYIRFITQDKEPERKPLTFYDGMPMDEYVQWQNMMFNRNSTRYSM